MDILQGRGRTFKIISVLPTLHSARQDHSIMSSRSKKFTVQEALEIIFDADSEIEEGVSEDEDYIKQNTESINLDFEPHEGAPKKKAQNGLELSERTGLNSLLSFWKSKQGPSNFHVCQGPQP